MNKNASSLQPERPRLILLTQWFDPEPTFKGLLFARALNEKGFLVEVVTGFPNYPGGKLYPGYNIRIIQRELIGDVLVTRLPLFPSHSNSKFGRITNYLSFFLSAFIYLTFFSRRADIVYAYHPPLTVGLAATCAKFFRRTTTVIDVQDMWPDTLRATGMIANAFALKLIELCCQWLYRSVNYIVVLSPGFRELLISRGVPQKKIAIIYNWADETALKPPNIIRPTEMANQEMFRVLFAGNIGKAQALDNVLDAAKIVARRNKKVEFIFLGDGLETNHLKSRATREKISNTLFIPQVPMAEVGHYLAAADCALVHLRSDPLFSITIPSKTQAYMAAGKPIIMAVEGDAAKLVIESGCGIVVPPGDPDALAEAICNLAAKSPAKRLAMARAAAHFYSRNLSVAAGVDRFVILFRRLILETVRK